MQPIIIRINLALVFVSLFFACGTSEKGEVAEASPETPTAEMAIDKETTGVLSPEEASFIRDTAAATLRKAADQPLAASTKKRQQWMLESPFGKLSACTDWAGEQRNISADCCKSLIISYQRLIDEKDDNLANVKLKDPYLAACKAFNDKLRATLDSMENPPRVSDSIPF